MSNAVAQPPRPAATVVLLRDGGEGCEVLMLRRHGRSGFAANAWVFPGGAVDPADRVLTSDRYRGIEPQQLRKRFGDPAEDVLGFHVAAVRETFEEAGILIASGDVPRADIERVRARLGSRDSAADAFAVFLNEYGLVLDLGALTYLSRWITPRMEGRRFHTAFFVATAPAHQVAQHDAVETTAKKWVRPDAALSAYRSGDMAMMRPTRTTLRWLADYDTAAQAASAAAAQTTIPWLLPHFEEDDAGNVRVLQPSDPGFPHELYGEELGGRIS